MSKVSLTSEEYEKILAFYEWGIGRNATPIDIQRMLDDLFGFHQTIVWCIDSSNQIHSPSLNHISEKLTKEYMTYFRNIDVLHPKQLSLAPANTIIRINEVMSWGQYEETEYYQDFMKRHGLYHEMGVFLYQEQGFHTGMGFIRPKEEPPFSKKDVSLLTHLMKPLSLFLNKPFDSAYKNLTRREVEIILLVKEGLTNKDIAAHLHVSENTVKKHLQHMYRKLNVSNRTSLCYMIHT